MRSWTWRRAVVAAAVGATLLTLAGSAVGAGKGPAKAKVTITGKDSFKPNAYLKLGEFFAPGTVTIRSGGTVTLTNVTSDPHTLSIIKPSQRPHTLEQVGNCSVCGAILSAHGINPEGPPTHGPPPHLVVNVGAAGFDTPGDSVVIGPKGHGGPVTFQVTARPGTTLSFVCAIHPWMQGRFLVK
jgi:plastocyanin